jgi:hypothetical protein
MPMRTSGSNGFNPHVAALKENLRYGHIPVVVSKDVYKISANKVTTYWVGSKDSSSVIIVVDTRISDSMCKVTLASKNPDYSSRAPYTSDLYLVIKDDIANNDLVFASDEYLSLDGERLWVGLVKRGNVISIFDTEKKQYVLNYVQDVNELTSYLGGLDRQRYIFVLSESLLESRGIFTTFAIMEIKRKANYPLFEKLSNC